jgi:hypothetical protein
VRLCGFERAVIRGRWLAGHPAIAMRVSTGRIAVVPRMSLGAVVATVWSSINRVGGQREMDAITLLLFAIAALLTMDIAAANLH